MYKTINYIDKINYYFSYKYASILFIIMILGVLVPAISVSSIYNYWDRIYFIFNNRLIYSLYFLSISSFVFYSVFINIKNPYLFNRYCKYDRFLKFLFKDFNIVFCFSFLLFLIITFAFAFLASSNDFSFISHFVYDLPLPLYLLFYIVRTFLIMKLINDILCYIFLIYGKRVFYCFIIIFNLYFFLLPLKNKICSILEGLQIPYLFVSKIYTSFYLELICSIIVITIFLIIKYLLKKLVLKHKNDLFI